MFTKWVYAQQETQLSLTNRATLCNGVVDLKHAYPHSCYHAEFGRSALKGVGINTGELQKLASGETPLSFDGRHG